MTDVEKLLARIETARDAISGKPDQTSLDYMIDGVLMECYVMLKEQEAVEPIPPNDESDLWRCGNCNHQLFRCTHLRYCEMCGREVKWDD